MANDLYSRPSELFRKHGYDSCIQAYDQTEYLLTFTNAIMDELGISKPQPKFAVLTLKDVRLVKLQTKDELEEITRGLDGAGIPFLVFENHGNVYSKMKQIR